MTDPTPTAAAPAEPIAAPSDVDTPSQPEPEPTRADKRRPAQDERYRQRAQEAEARADLLAERLARRDAIAAERMAGTVLHDPADLWAGGVQPADLLDDDGNLDSDKVIAAAKQVHSEHPHWGPHGSPAAPTSLVGQSAITPHRDQQDEPGRFRAAFTPPDRR